MVVDNLANGRRTNLDGVDCSFFETDIRDQGAMERLLEGVDTVYHLACLGVRHSIHSPYENHEVNAEATLRLLQLARKHSVGRFVYVSTSEVYGTAREVPMTESHPTFPMTVYGASKLAGECYTRAFWETYRYPTVVVRPFNSFGPRSHHEGDSGEVIPKFLLRLLAGQELLVFGDGEQPRDFTFVSDTARGIRLAGEHPAAVGETFNLGSNQEISLNELAEVAKRVVGADSEIKHVPPRPGDVLRLYADSTKARNTLSFSPEIAFEEGMRKLLDWYQAQGDSPDQLLKDEVAYNWELSKT